MGESERDRKRKIFRIWMWTCKICVLRGEERKWERERYSEYEYEHVNFVYLRERCISGEDRKWERERDIRNINVNIYILCFEGRRKKVR